MKLRDGFESENDGQGTQMGSHLEKAVFALLRWNLHGKHETAQRVLPLAIGAAYASDALQSGTSPTRLLIRDADGVGQRAVEVQEPPLGRVDCRKEDDVEGEEQIPQRVEDGQIKHVLLPLEEEGQRSLPQ